MSMLGLLVVTSILIALVTIYQYREETEDYHRERLKRKEHNIKENIDYVLKNTTYPLETKKIPLIFKSKIYELKDIHNLEIYLYDLEGQLLISSKPSFLRDTSITNLSKSTLNNIQNSIDKHHVVEFKEGQQKYQSSYSYITDTSFKPLAILNLPYIEEDGFIKKELNQNLKRLALAYGFMLIIAVAAAYFLSRYITHSLKTISDKITKTRLNKRNKKISLSKNTSQEISSLVEAYNAMIDDLENSAAQLAASEREAAWREMAKQVAHEIKNPLTPMRLTVQSFQRKFNPKDSQIHQKLAEYTYTLIQQIDTMSSIASAFSTYAQMPAQQDETLNLVKTIKLALDIFNEDYIYFFPAAKEIISTFDRTHLTRIITNLIKNSIQAIEQKDFNSPRIEIKVFSEGNNAVITVMDNGIGISDANKALVFEPKFTTKSSGMGLGLAMIKNIVNTYKGSISFVSKAGEGTTFKVVLPRR